MRGLTQAGANSNNRKAKVAQRLENTYPDFERLSNGWRVFQNPGQSDVDFMEHLAKSERKNYTFWQGQANTEELFNFLKEYNYLHEFKQQLPLLLKNIDCPIDAPNGFTNGQVKYLLKENRYSMRVLVAEKGGKKYIWSYPLTGYEKHPNEYFISESENGKWATWEGDDVKVVFV